MHSLEFMVQTVRSLGRMNGRSIGLMVNCPSRKSRSRFSVHYLGLSEDEKIKELRIELADSVLYSMFSVSIFENKIRRNLTLEDVLRIIEQPEGEILRMIRRTMHNHQDIRALFGYNNGKKEELEVYFNNFIECFKDYVRIRGKGVWQRYNINSREENKYTK